jgi:hypothetical protein
MIPACKFDLTSKKTAKMMIGKEQKTAKEKNSKKTAILLLDSNSSPANDQIMRLAPSSSWLGSTRCKF